MRIALRPSVAEDLPPLGIEALPHRIKAMTAFAGDRPVGIGGLVMMPDGTAWASVQITDDARRFKVALVRAARAVLEQAKSDGIRFIYAKAEPGRAGAEALLEHLGFERDGDDIWIWRA